MATSKLLANSDRGGDDGVFSRDLIDLAMMAPGLALLRQATLPPFGLADGIAALAISQAILTALYAQKNPASEGFGVGQVIDLAIIEPILAILGPQPTVYDQLGIIQARNGNRSVNNSPRNTYLTLDNRWVAISTSAQSIAERVMHLVGHAEVIAEEWFKQGRTRAEHADLLDKYVGDWISARSITEVIEAFESAEAAVAPIYDVSDIFSDPQFQALDTLTTVQDPELGPVRMQNVLYRMSRTPGSIRWTGRDKGADTYSILSGEVGLTDAQIEVLKEHAVVYEDE